MKKLIIVLSVCLTSCRPSAENNKPEPNGKFGDFRVVQVDNCEYVVFDYGVADNRVFAMTHKGNCKNHQIIKTKSGQNSSIVIDDVDGSNSIEVNQQNNK